MTYSIAQCRQAVEHLIALCESQAQLGFPNQITLKAKQACVILAWLERRQELIRAVERLDRERPDLVDLFRAFPGAEIADVRQMFPSYANGSGVDDAE